MDVKNPLLGKSVIDDHMRDVMTLNHSSVLHSLLQGFLGGRSSVPSTPQTPSLSLQHHVVGSTPVLFTTIILEHLQEKTVGVILQKEMIELDDVVQVIRREDVRIQ